MSVPDFARTLGVHYMTYRKWEVVGSTPSPHVLKHGIRLLNVQEWELLFSWLCDGTGELPWWFEKEVPVPTADTPLPPEIEELRRRGPLLYAGTRSAMKIEGPLPLLSIELLAQRARLALERGDLKEAAAAEHELLAIVCPRCTSHRASADATPPGGTSRAGAPDTKTEKNEKTKKERGDRT